MTKLKPSRISDDKPVKVTIELPAAIHGDLVAYAEVLARETHLELSDPLKLIAPMIARFMLNDRAFNKMRKMNGNPQENSLNA